MLWLLCHIWNISRTFRPNQLCVKIVEKRKISGLCFPAFGLNTEIFWVNLRSQSKYRKMRTRNNSVFGQFSRSAGAFNVSKQGRYIRRTTIFIFSFCIELVTQLNGSALGVLKHHYITKRIPELLIGNSRFLIYNSLN